MELIYDKEIESNLKEFSVSFWIFLIGEESSLGSILTINSN